MFRSAPLGAESDGDISCEAAVTVLRFTVCFPLDQDGAFLFKTKSEFCVSDEMLDGDAMCFLRYRINGIEKKIRRQERRRFLRRRKSPQNTIRLRPPLANISSISAGYTDIALITGIITTR